MIIVLKALVKIARAQVTFNEMRQALYRDRQKKLSKRYADSAYRARAEISRLNALALQDDLESLKHQDASIKGYLPYGVRSLEARVYANRLELVIEQETQQ